MQNSEGLMEKQVFLEKMHEGRGNEFLPVCLRVASTKSQRNGITYSVPNKREDRWNREQEVSFLRSLLW